MAYRFTALVALAALLAGQAAAQDRFNPITYIDADLDSNTIQQPTDSIFSDDEWTVREEFGVGGSLLQFLPGDGDDPLELRTTITGLTPGVEYNLYAFFWDDTPGEGWFIDTSLTGDLTPGAAFDNFNAVTDLDNNAGPVFEAAVLPIENLSAINQTNDRIGDGSPEDTITGTTLTVELTPGVSGNDTTISNGDATNTDLFAALFETITADSSGEVDVFIRNVSIGNRVWYDGLGFQPTAGAPGDADGDLDADLDDYLIIAGQIGSAVTPGTGGDVFGDGFVDLQDFAIWQQNRTVPLAGPASASVPEPVSLLLAGVLALSGLATRSAARRSRPYGAH